MYIYIYCIYSIYILHIIHMFIYIYTTHTLCTTIGLAAEKTPPPLPQGGGNHLAGEGGGVGVPAHIYIYTYIYIYYVQCLVRSYGSHSPGTMFCTFAGSPGHWQGGRNHQRVASGVATAATVATVAMASQRLQDVQL